MQSRIRQEPWSEYLRLAFWGAAAVFYLIADVWTFAAGFALCAIGMAHRLVKSRAATSRPLASMSAVEYVGLGILAAGAIQFYQAVQQIA